MPKQPLRRSAVRGLMTLALVVFCLAAAPEALGCPNCKDAVNTSDPEGLSVARGYFYSILIMLAMPFTLVGSFGMYVWREMRRQQRSCDEVTGLSPPAGSQTVASSPPAAAP